MRRTRRVPWHPKALSAFAPQSGRRLCRPRSQPPALNGFEREAFRTMVPGGALLRSQTIRLHAAPRERPDLRSDISGITAPQGAGGRISHETDTLHAAFRTLSEAPSCERRNTQRARTGLAGFASVSKRRWRDHDGARCPDGSRSSALPHDRAIGSVPLRRSGAPKN
jgi:hypothetical protein